MADYDALLLQSFGGPEGPDDVLPFLRNVTRGRDVPEERLAEVAEQYLAFGGRSPINEQNVALLDALGAELARRGHDLARYRGNRNWTPTVEEALAAIAADGHRSVLALSTSLFSSYSACRQYHEDIDRALATVDDGGPKVTRVRPSYDHPGFVGATVDLIARAADEAHDPSGRTSAVTSVPKPEPAPVTLAFTAHSIPVAMAATSDYADQLGEIAALVVDRLVADRGLAVARHDLVFQSRSGPPQVPWLEPDIVDHLGTLADEGVARVFVVPIGFTSDHMEVRYDLDTQAAAAGRSLGIEVHRVPTVGTHPMFVSGLVDVLEEYLIGAPAQGLGRHGPRPAACAAGCCPAPVSRPVRR